MCSVGKLSERALEIALAEMAAGAREIGGNNRGPWVRKYLALCGLPEGNPWCAAFVSWCYVEAAKSLGMQRAFKPIAGAKRVYAAAKKAGGARDQAHDAEPGDIICWTRGGANAATGHVGMVHHIDDECVIHTIEGNKTSRVALFKHPLVEPGRIGIARVDDPALVAKP